MIVHTDAFARAILVALGSGMLVAAVLALIVAVIARALEPSATTRHVLWWIAFSVAAVLPIATIGTSMRRIEHRTAVVATAHVRDEQRGSANARDGATNAGRSANVRRTADPQPAAHGAAAPLQLDWLALGTAAARAAGSLPVLPTALVGSFLTVAIVRLGLLVPGIVWLLRVKRAALPLDESIVRRLRRYRHGMRTGRAATIALSADIDVPIAVGFGTPAILLPIRVAEIETIADLDQIVMHEHAHLNRYDDVTNFVQCIVERLFWFNPVIAFAGRRISLEREIACDDAVVAQTGRAHRYATCLWKLVESAHLPARPVMAPGALLTTKQITRRIEQLLDSKRNALPRLSPASALVLGTLSAGLIFVQAQRAPVIALEDPVSPSASASPRGVAQHAARASAIRDTEPDAIDDISAKAAGGETKRAFKHLLPVGALAEIGVGSGIDIAKDVAESIAPLADIPHIERSLEHAKIVANREILVADGGANGMRLESGGIHRNLPAFRRIEIDGSNDVIVRRGSSNYVDFQNDAELASHTRTIVDGGSLVIDQTGDSYDDRPHKAIVVYAGSIGAIEIDGSADVKLENASGERLAIAISGSGNLVATGSVSNVDLRIEGSGDADMLGLIASTIHISSEGSGSVKVTAPQTLAISLQGSGDVAVRGTPKHVSTEINGSGSITRI
jgi:beta-lactamase regulating signal transducer with metallopeptidase domain